MTTDLPHVFLGGTCGDSTWRQDVAIPVLKTHGITYYNPQVSSGEWNSGMIDIETTAKNNAVQLLIVISGQTRGTASILEAAEYICYGTFVHLVIEDIEDGTEVLGHVISGRELADLNRARDYLRSLVKRRRPQLRVFDSVKDAMEAIVIIADAYGAHGTYKEAW